MANEAQNQSLRDDMSWKNTMSEDEDAEDSATEEIECFGALGERVI